MLEILVVTVFVIVALRVAVVWMATRTWPVTRGECDYPHCWLLYAHSTDKSFDDEPKAMLRRRRFWPRRPKYTVRVVVGDKYLVDRHDGALTFYRTEALDSEQVMTLIENNPSHRVLHVHDVPVESVVV